MACASECAGEPRYGERKPRYFIYAFEKNPSARYVTGAIAKTTYVMLMMMFMLIQR